MRIGSDGQEPVGILELVDTETLERRKLRLRFHVIDQIMREYQCLPDGEGTRI